MIHNYCKDYKLSIISKHRRFFQYGEESTVFRSEEKKKFPKCIRICFVKKVKRVKKHFTNRILKTFHAL